MCPLVSKVKNFFVVTYKEIARPSAAFRVSNGATLNTSTRHVMSVLWLDDWEGRSPIFFVPNNFYGYA